MAYTLYDLIGQWNSAGLFDIMLPFLLIFAVIFGILTASNILGKNRGIHLVIALAIALLAIRIPLVSVFFSAIFPKLGIGLAIMLTVLILIGLFAYGQDGSLGAGWKIGLGIAGAVLAIIIVLMSFDNFDWFGSFFWQQYWGVIIGLVLLAILIIAIFVMAKPKEGSSGKPHSS